MATSRAVAAVKRAKVVEAVAAGVTYEQAAQKAGYATRSGAYKGFWKAVDGRQADAVDEPPDARGAAPGHPPGGRRGQGDGQSGMHDRIRHAARPTGWTRKGSHDRAAPAIGG